MKKSLNVFLTILIPNPVWPHSPKRILVITNTWDKYLFSFWLSKHISIRDCIRKWIEYIWQNVWGHIPFKKPSSVVVSEKLLRNFCSISDSLSAHAYLCRCQVASVIFSAAWYCCGFLLVIFLWISEGFFDVWFLFTVPKTKTAKVPCMFCSVVLTCAVQSLGRFTW